MKDNTVMVKKMAMENSNSQMDQCMKGILKIITLMVVAHMFGQMVGNILDNGGRI